MGEACGTYGGERRCVQGFDGKTWRKVAAWKDSIKVDFKEIGCEGVNWIRLAPDRNKRRDLLNTAMYLRVA